MKLWRAVGQKELDKLLAGKTIKPIRDITDCKNSWTKSVVTFFGTANNAACWFNELTHDFIVCIDAADTAVQRGKGRYPDFSKPIDPVLLLLLGDSGAAVWVKEYALPEYSNKTASVIAVYQVRRDETMKKYLLQEWKSGETLQVGSVYDDLMDGKR